MCGWECVCCTASSLFTPVVSVLLRMAYAYHGDDELFGKKKNKPKPKISFLRFIPHTENRLAVVWCVNNRSIPVLRCMHKRMAANGDCGHCSHEYDIQTCVVPQCSQYQRCDDDRWHSKTHCTTLQIEWNGNSSFFCLFHLFRFLHSVAVVFAFFSTVSVCVEDLFPPFAKELACRFCSFNRNDGTSFLCNRAPYPISTLIHR